MTHLHDTPDWRLPDPALQPAFYADVPLKRFLAFLVDFVLLLILAAVLVIFTFGIAAIFMAPVWWLLNLFYRSVAIAQGSATPGMRLFAIEFRNADGHRLSGGEAFLHSLGFMISFTFFPLQLVSMAMMVLSERKQGLTDHAMGTVAINRRAGY